MFKQFFSKVGSFFSNLKTKMLSLFAKALVYWNNIDAKKRQKIEICLFSVLLLCVFFGLIGVFTA